MTGGIGNTLRALAQVGRNRALRRAEAAFALFVAAEVGSWVAILVYAYGRGGSAEAGIAAAVQLVPAAVLAPLAGAAADRFGGARTLVAGYALQCATMAGVAVALAVDAPAWSVYAVAASAAAAVTATRPTHAIVAPALARSPLELSAANVVSGWTTATMSLAAPALVGVLLTATGPATALAASAAAAGAATVLAARLPREQRPSAPAGSALSSAVAEVAAGLDTLRTRRSVRLVVELTGALSVLVGAIDVLAVALGLGTLHLGAGGAGYLTAAFGAGGILGAGAALSLIGRRRLVPHFLVAALAGGVSLVALGLWPTVASSFVLLGLAGAAQILFNVVAQTLLQRTAPSHVLSRIFSLSEGLTMAGMAAGSLVVPLLVALGGIRTALIGVGALLPVLVALRLRSLLAVDDEATVPVVEISLLREMRIFSLLPAPELEGLAHALIALQLRAGAAVVVEGDAGDRFYAIADGSVVVTRAGQFVARLGRGEGFGEIALLDDVPRTATVTAETDIRLYALERSDFLIALTGHAPAHERTREIVAGRLDELERLGTAAP